jgi:predicted Zn finger-like uncharacterized protein
MKLAAGIRKHGFRKWYERELLHSHAYMALAFACLIGLFAAFEAASRFRGLEDQLIDVLSIVICSGVGLWALRRYLFLLMHAEAVAHQADCPSCGAYAKFQLVHADSTDDVASVRCRKCQHEWLIRN